MLGSLVPSMLTLVVVAAGVGALMAMWPPLRMRRAAKKR